MGAFCAHGRRPARQQAAGPGQRRGDRASLGHDVGDAAWVAVYNARVLIFDPREGGRANFQADDAREVRRGVAATSNARRAVVVLSSLANTLFRENTLKGVVE